MKKLFVVFCFAMLTLAACSDNIFGKGDSGSDAKSLRLDAEDAFRKGNYAKAYEICSKIVANDSTASYGYYCAAQAGLWDVLKKKGESPLSLFNFIDQKKMEEGQIPFLDETDAVKTLYYRAMITVNNPLNELNRRDSLTLLWELSKLPPSELAKTKLPKKLDSLRNVGKLDSLIEALCPQNENCNKFPVSDREYKAVAFSYDLTISRLTTTLLGVLDFTNDGCIAIRGGDFTDEDWRYWDCVAGNYDFPFNLTEEDGKTVPDLSEAVEDIDAIANDFYSDPANYDKLPPEIVNINDKFDSFEGDLQSTIDLLNQNNIPQSGDFEEDFNKYKKYVSFYRIGTHIDEDGDGCIDEGILDGRVDGDGLKGANSRIFDIPTINNTMSDYPNDNKIIEVDHPICISNGNEGCTVIDPDEKTGKVKVLAYALKNEYWTSNDSDDKLLVAQDTACGRIEYDLEERKQMIGGCWLNYKGAEGEQKFVDYILKRKWATAADREKRVHPNCKTCQGYNDCVGK